MGEFQQREIGFGSLSERLDTTTAAGPMTFHIFDALAVFERGLIQERTVAGLEAARARGCTADDPAASRTHEVAAWRRCESRTGAMPAVAAALGVS